MKKSLILIFSVTYVLKKNRKNVECDCKFFLPTAQDRKETACGVALKAKLSEETLEITGIKRDSDWIKRKQVAF